MADHEETEVDEAGPAETPFDELLDDIEGGSVDAEEDDEASDTDDAGVHAMLDRFEPGRPGAGTTFDDLLDRVREGARRSERSDDASATRFPRINAGESALLMETLGSEDDDELCIASFEHVHPETLGLVLVSLTRRGPSRHALVRDTYGNDVGRIAHVHRGKGETTDVVESITVDDPENLSQLGISISTLLRDWEEDNLDVRVCIHSLSTLLQHADRQRVFRFIHVLLGRVEAVDGRIHVHMDADRHDAETRILFEQLFDVTVRVDGDGVETAR